MLAACTRILNYECHDQDIEGESNTSYGNERRDSCSYSNCKAAILDGKPITTHIISQGLFFDVRIAPPLESPLC